MRRSPRASAWRRSSASSRSWPSPSSIPTAAPRCWRARATCASAASGWCREIEAELIKTLKEGGLEAQVSGREKTPYSIWRKMQTQERLVRAARRHHGVPHHRRRRRAVLPGARAAARPLPGAAAALQGLHLGAQAERLPLAAYRRDRPARPAHRDPDPHRGDAGPGRARRRRALDLQAGRAVDRCAAIRLAAQPDRNPRQGAQRRGIPRAHQARDVPGPGVLLHAQGQADRPAARRHADRLRLRRAQPGRRHLRRRQDQRPHAAAAHAALQRRPGRDHHLEGADAVADLGTLRRHRQGQGRDPPLHPHAPARAVPPARQVAARQDLPRGGLRGHREGPRRRARQLQAGEHRRPGRRRRRGPGRRARGADGGLSGPQAAAQERRRRCRADLAGAQQGGEGGRRRPRQEGGRARSPSAA